MSTQRALTDTSLPDYLRSIGLIEAGEPVSVEKAGDGNINWVRRVRRHPPGGAASSCIVKQARPALERFPQYQVSTERLVFEARWLEEARPFDTTGVCPAVHRVDAEQRVLVLEDLGDAERLDAALARGAEVGNAVVPLAAFLGRVHHGTRERPGLAERFRNEAMRRLHGDHIFVLPLRENDFALPPRTRERAEALWADRELVAIADAAYARYLEPRGALVHGDVQAGNVLLPAGRPKLLDAEIAHVGDPAFDLGMWVAHLMLPAAARGEPGRAREAIAAADAAYRVRLGGALEVPFAEAARHAGMEMLRRTIGAARVACVEAPEAGLAVLGQAVAWLREPPAGP